MRIISLLLISLFLYSCSYEKRLARANRRIANAIQEFPQLAKKDTIFKDTILYTAPKDIHGEINIANRESRIDSLLKELKNPTSNKDTIINQIHNQFINIPILKDTFIVDTIGIEFKLYQKGNKLVYNIHVDEDSLKHRYATEVNTVTPIKEVKKRWYEQVWDSMVNWLAIIGILAIIFIILDLIASKMK
jgi:hypothetical protein